MKTKIFIIGLIVTSLIGYLEWAGDNSSFLFQIEYDVLGKIFTNPVSIIHPIIIIPFLGQLILVFSLFLKHPNTLSLKISIIGIGILFTVLLLIGIIELNFKMILSVLPYFLLAILLFRHFKQPT